VQDLNLLKSVLAQGLFQNITAKNGSYSACLKENGANASLKEVEIIDIAKDSVLLKMDRIKAPDKLFRKGRGQLKRCDYLLITEVFKKKLMIFIEMKPIGKNASEFKEEIIQQFKSTDCIVDYIKSVLSKFYDENAPFKNHEKRYIQLYKSIIDKKSTRINKSSSKHNIPTNYYKYPISEKTISLKTLIRK